MTGTLPNEVQEVFDRFITTEYVTVDGRGQPIVWPVTPYYRPGSPTIDVTTGVGYPKKALDAARDPRVGLLFSDPTGSGIEAAPAVLVQGTADVDDEDLGANRERYKRESLEKLPATKDALPPKLIEGMFGWYFERIYVKVRPERVFIWPDGNVAKEPELLDTHIEEVRSGHSEEPLQPPPEQTGEGTAWDERIEELGRRHFSAVIAWTAPDRFPLAVRVAVEPDRDAGRIRLVEEPEGVPLLEGRGCLTAHAHAPDFSWQENFQVRGDLVRDERGWSLVPQKLIGGFELPDESELARYRRNFKKSIRFYRKRKNYLKARSR